ncbi:CheR family methyltransferase (plasmid) [Halopseudomonas sp. SMJS2]|uniref:CheR family methyltransferase n=1 Tax=Halopseudomonas sp. SMJS2 TaxID=3041098 RepID=UPI00245322F5|nr:CheR family methyltransferase [Halopseudomonas sp. SMJS2]WGK63387.1 CheR family methyltransferase [Halopseudomonas sp. SMJS2]
MAENCQEGIDDRWAALVAERFSIEVDEQRNGAFVANLVSYSRRIGMDSEELFDRATTRKLDASHWSAIVHLATNHETKFFRYMPILSLIETLCLRKRNPQVLSVGCSTGEEPYSIAARLLRSGHALFRVHGTDVSRSCIEKAQAGVYKPHPDMRTDIAANTGNGTIRIHQWVRDAVTFEVHNIMGDMPISFTSPDVIVTQNMLIYYKVETRHEILTRLGMMLPTNGYLITGPAEDAAWMPESLERIPNPTATIFRKV